METLLPLIAICLSCISVSLVSYEKEANNYLEVKELTNYVRELFEVETYLKTHIRKIVYVVSPERNSPGLVAYNKNLSTISRGMGRRIVQTPQEFFSPSILQTKSFLNTI